jgi:hypothetical protein
MVELLKANKPVVSKLIPNIAPETDGIVNVLPPDMY